MRELGLFALVLLLAPKGGAEGQPRHRALVELFTSEG